MNSNTHSSDTIQNQIFKSHKRRMRYLYFRYNSRLKVKYCWIKGSFWEIIPHATFLEYIGQRGISLSGSYQQGYSTTYNTQSRIKVVCNGYILAHILNCNSWGGPRTLLSKGETPSGMIRSQRPICMLVTCARVNITAFWHGF